MGSDKQIEAPVEFSDAAMEESGEGGLTLDQFALRLEAKREQAYQDAGWTVPPGAPGDPAGPLDPVDAEEEDDEEADEGPEEEPAEPQVEPEVQPEVEPQEEEPEEEDDFFVGRYKTKEAAEAALREKDETIDRIFRELHEQRQQIEWALQEEQQTQVPGQIDVPAWEQWAENAVQVGAGANGAIEALRTGGQPGYNLYLRAWMDDDDQRGEALAFNNQVMLELAEQRARMAIEPYTADMQQKNSAAEAVAARERVSELYTDFPEYKEEIDRLVEEEGILPEETKLWLTEVARSGFEGKVRAWEYLYLAAARNRAPKRQKAARTEQKRRRTSADSAKVAATVSTTEGTVSRTPPAAAEAEATRRRNELRKEWGLPLLEE